MKRFAVIRYAFAARSLHLAFTSVLAETRSSSAALSPPPASQETGRARDTREREIVTQVVMVRAPGRWPLRAALPVR